MDKINFILDNLPNFYNKEDTSNVNIILSAIAKELDAFVSKLDEVKKAKFVDYAVGNDLDKIASILNMKRFNNENDDAFRSRIKSKVPSFVGGGAISALKQVVNNYLGVEPAILEHYKPGEGHVNFTNNALNGLSVEKIDSNTLRIKSGIAYVDGIKYNLPEITNANQNGFVKYNIITALKKYVANYINKISGSTVENPHLKKTLNSVSLQPPTAFTSETSQTRYGYLSALDGINIDSESVTVNGAMIQQLFSFNIVAAVERNIGTIPATTLVDKITWLKNNINKITANWFGWGTNLNATPSGKTDFTGKISGSVTENANIAKGGNSASLTTPSTTFAELVTGGAWNGYDRIKTQNNDSFSWNTSVNGNISQTLFSFNLIEYIKRKYGFTPDVAWLKANISSLTFNWYGYGSGPSGNKANIVVWNDSAQLYAGTVMSHSLGTITKIAYRLDNPYIRIETNGYAHFLAYAEASNGTIASTLNTDFVELQVDLIPGANKATMAVWRSANNTWTDLAAGGLYHTQNVVTQLTGNTLYADYPSGILDSNGFVHFLAYAPASNGAAPSVINTDYMELEIEMKGNNPYITIDSDSAVRSNQILLANVVSSNPTDMRTFLNPEEDYITNTASITVQIPYAFNTSNISLEDVKDILRHTKAAGIALLIKIMETYNESIVINDKANYIFIVGFSGIGGNNILGG